MPDGTQMPPSTRSPFTAAQTINTKFIPSVLIVGAGIGGITLALDLDEVGLTNWIVSPRSPASMAGKWWTGRARLQVNGWVVALPHAPRTPYPSPHHPAMAIQARPKPYLANTRWSTAKTTSAGRGMSTATRESPPPCNKADPRGCRCE